MKNILLNLSITPTMEVESIIFYLHVPIYLMLPKQDRLTLVKLVKTFTANLRFYQNLGKLKRKCSTSIA